jgi:hypothetical protein
MEEESKRSKIMRRMRQMEMGKKSIKERGNG